MLVPSAFSSALVSKVLLLLIESEVKFKGLSGKSHSECRIFAAEDAHAAS